jgi:hypothetical protein
MPSSEKRLRDKFMTVEIGDDGEEHFDDGIIRCERIIQEAGGDIVGNGYFSYAGNDPEVVDACNYLCQEWDYAWLDKGELESVRRDMASFDEQI